MMASSQLAPLAPGSLFTGRYRIRSVIATGGMGTVYLAEQTSTGARRALKLLHPQFVDDERMRRRFEHEARAEARIGSDHVVRVIEAGIDEATDVPWIAMEYLEGEDLHAALERRGALPPDEALEILRQICDALAAAHAVGIVHRDLKPENVFLSPSRQPSLPFLVKVLDFGIARMAAETRTTETAPLGTPLWMAPEQTAASSTVGPAADVWALGLLAYRMLTGSYYWRGAQGRVPSLMGVMREIVVEPIADASARAAEHGFTGTLPAGFDAWFARCVNRDADARFADAGEAFEAFAALWRMPRAPRSMGRPATAAAAAAPRQLTLAVVLGAGMVALGLVALALLRPPRPAPSPPTPIVQPGPGAQGGSVSQAGTVAPPAPVSPPAAAPADSSSPAPATDARSRCEGGDATACGESGQAYELGQGGPADVVTALQLYRKGCALGARASCDDAARLASAGHPALALAAEQKRQILHEACVKGVKAWCPPPTLSERCNKGSAEACMKQAGNEQDAHPEAALRHYLKACKLHEHDGCKVILVWGAQKCHAGMAEGCTVTGEILLSGIAGFTNRELGLTMLRLGCNGGDSDACELLD